MGFLDYFRDKKEAKNVSDKEPTYEKKQYAFEDLILCRMYYQEGNNDRLSVRILIPNNNESKIKDITTEEIFTIQDGFSLFDRTGLCNDEVRENRIKETFSQLGYKNIFFSNLWDELETSREELGITADNYDQYKKTLISELDADRYKNKLIPIFEKKDANIVEMAKKEREEQERLEIIREGRDF